MLIYNEQADQNAFTPNLQWQPINPLGTWGTWGFIPDWTFIATATDPDVVDTGWIATFQGHNGDNSFTGDNNNDTMFGEGGNDRLEGLNGNDVIYGGGEDDIIRSGGGDDQEYGGSGNDWHVGSQGADRIDGGTDIDTVDYTASSAAVNVNLASGQGFGGDAQGDIYAGGRIENVFGSMHDDELRGTNGANTMVGGSGDDEIHGEGGNDLIIGGGNGSHGDVLFGDGGDDKFYFGIGDSNGASVSQWDRIRDFDQDGDDVMVFDVHDPSQATWTKDALPGTNGEVVISIWHRDADGNGEYVNRVIVETNYGQIEIGADDIQFV